MGSTPTTGTYRLTRMAAQVFGPTTPSAVSFFMRWYALTAASVRGPKEPSSGTPSHR